MQYLLLMRRTRATPVLSAGVVPVVLDEADPCFLLLRAFNYWDFPKGIVEPGESPIEGAVRELAEETGLARVDFPWGEDFIETEPYSYGKIARYYLGRVYAREVKLLANPVLGHIEHHEYRWVRFDEAFALLVPRVQIVLEWAHARLMARMPLVTARSLAPRLGDQSGPELR